MWPADSHPAATLSIASATAVARVSGAGQDSGRELCELVACTEWGAYAAHITSASRGLEGGSCYWHDSAGRSLR